MDMELAKKARMKGIAGMTRISGYYQTHKVTATYDDLVRWFRDEGMFLESTMTDDKTKNEYKVQAILMTDRSVIKESTGVDYNEVRREVLNALLSDLPDKKGVKM